ncbi:MAG: hypothetical protein FJ313_05510, partial [Gemmatimonadetes bacterium]|nr:hypothetical protein [Gemmatimonadota bacterium]
ADPLNISATMDRVGAIMPPGGHQFESYQRGVLVALDIGLHDLLGKILEVPVYTLLGGKRRDRIPFCYPIFPVATPIGEDPSREIRDNIRRVQRVKDLGFFRIRKYIGYNLDAEEEWLRTFRRTFGNEIQIKSLDLSGRFYWQDALALLRRFMEFDYEVAESVSRYREPKGMAEVRRQLGKPISEHINDYQRIIEYRDAGAIDVVNIATCASGIAKTKDLFDFAQRIGLRALHGTTQELSIGTAAAAHVMAAIDRIDVPCDPAGPILYMDDCTRNRVKYEDSCVVVPDGPGLGIEVDEDHLEEIAYSGERLRRMRTGAPDGD